MADMGISKIPATQEYTHAYFTWKRITDNEFT